MTVIVPTTICKAVQVVTWPGCTVQNVKRKCRFFFFFFSRRTNLRATRWSNEYICSARLRTQNNNNNNNNKLIQNRRQRTSTWVFYVKYTPLWEMDRHECARVRSLHCATFCVDSEVSFSVNFNLEQIGSKWNPLLIYFCTDTICSWAITSFVS